MNRRIRKPKFWQSAVSGLLAAFTFFPMSSRAAVKDRPVPESLSYPAAAAHKRIPTTPAEERLAAEDILRKMVSAYQALHSYQDETRVSAYTQRGRTVPDLEIPFGFKWRGPNKVALSFLGYSLISDGQWLWQHRPTLKRCTRQKAPESLHRLGDILAVSPVTRMAHRAIVLSLLIGDGGAEFLKAMEDCRLVRTERVGEDEAFVVDITDQSRTQRRIWIGKDDYRIYRAFADYTETILDPSKIGGPPVKFTAETHKYIQANKRISDSTFHFPGPRHVDFTERIAVPAGDPVNSRGWSVAKSPENYRPTHVRP